MGKDIATTAPQVQESEILNLLRAGASESMPIYFVRSLFFYWDKVAELLKDGKVSVEQILVGDSEELAGIVEDEVKTAYKSILSHLETGLASQPELFAKLRPIVLRAGNDAIRNLKLALADFHTLRYAETKTTVIYQAPEEL